MSLNNKVEYRVVERIDGQDRLLRRTWYAPRTEALHRVGGPTVEIFEPESGKLIGEIWINQYRHGKHRDGNLPSEFTVDPETSIITREEFYQNNRHHRDDGGPTEIYRDNVTGHVTRLVFSYEGLHGREGDLPAVQEFSEKNGRLLREEFYSLGQLHRECGPAIIEYDPSGTPIPSSLQYYLRGKKLSTVERLGPSGP